MMAYGIENTISSNLYLLKYLTDAVCIPENVFIAVKQNAIRQLRIHAVESLMNFRQGVVAINAGCNETYRTGFC